MEKQASFDGRLLPIIVWNGKRCFFDERLRQATSVDDPKDREDLSDMECFFIKSALSLGASVHQETI